MFLSNRKMNLLIGFPYILFVTFNIYYFSYVLCSITEFTTIIARIDGHSVGPYWHLQWSFWIGRRNTPLHLSVCKCLECVLLFDLFGIFMSCFSSAWPLHLHISVPFYGRRVNENSAVVKMVILNPYQFFLSNTICITHFFNYLRSGNPKSASEAN